MASAFPPRWGNAGRSVVTHCRGPGGAPRSGPGAAGAGGAARGGARGAGRGGAARVGGAERRRWRSSACRGGTSAGSRRAAPRAAPTRSTCSRCGRGAGEAERRPGAAAGLGARRTVAIAARSRGPGRREGRGAVPAGPCRGGGGAALGAGRGPTGLRGPGQDVSRAPGAWHPRRRSKGPRAAAAASPDPARGGQVAASPAGLPGAALPRGTRGSVRAGLPGRAAGREPAGRPRSAPAEPAALWGGAGGRVGLCPALCERAVSGPGRGPSPSLPLDHSCSGEALSRAGGQGRSSVPADLGPRGSPPGPAAGARPPPALRGPGCCGTR